MVLQTLNYIDGLIPVILLQAPWRWQQEGYASAMERRRCTTSILACAWWQFDPCLQRPAKKILQRDGTPFLCIARVYSISANGIKSFLLSGSMTAKKFTGISSVRRIVFGTRLLTACLLLRCGGVATVYWKLWRYIYTW